MLRRAAVLLATGLMLTGCGSSSGGGASTTPITLGALFDLSGPTADVGAQYGDGVRDYFRWRNDHGGVAGGRKVELKWNDYKYDVPTAEQLYSQYVSQGALAIIGYGTGDTEALKAKVSTDKKPFVSASYAEALTSPTEFPYNFVPGTTYSDQIRIALNWIATKASGHTEVAVFYNNSPFGLAPLADGEKWLKEKNLDIGYTGYAMPKDLTALPALITQARKQGSGGAKFIIIQNVPTPAVAVVKNVAETGGGIQIVCLNYCASEGLIAGAGKTAVEGAVGVAPWLPPSINVAGDKAPSDELTASGRSIVQEGVFYLDGWYTAALMAEAIDKASKNGALTGESVKAAFETISNFDTGGVSAPISFTSTSHKGMAGASLIQVTGGKWTKLSDVAKP